VKEFAYGRGKKTRTIALAVVYALVHLECARAYTFGMVVPDIRQPAALSGGSACPVRAHQLTAAGNIAFRWSTSVNPAVTTVITQNTTASGQLAEIEQAISASLAVWTGVAGTTLTPSSLSPLARTSASPSCAADGINSICFGQADSAFTPGVLAFTRTVTADRIGEQFGSSAASSAPGQILDADVYFNPGDSNTTFATPPALAGNPKSYDLESILTHELGHALGFGHSAVWSAMMFPYAHAPGTFATPRPTTTHPDAPLGEDDRTGLRVLYPDPSNLAFSGSISGRVMPANPLSLAASGPGVTGIFGTQVVALDQSTGAVVGASIGGWSCAGSGPAVFDGSYKLEGLAVGHTYLVYAEALDGAVDPSQLGSALQNLCRNGLTDAGWPAQFSCSVPPPLTEFTMRTRPSP
jgi:hypothetical protein